MHEALPIVDIRTFVLRVPRDFGRAIGGAGTPSALHEGSARYTRAANYKTIYSQWVEAFLVRIEAGSYVGWGEAQTPIAPEICNAILEHLLGPMLLGQDAIDPPAIYRMLYESMRVRGHWNGFFPDALAAIDLALWDIAGQFHSQPVSALLSQSPAQPIPTYVSGLVGRTVEEQVAFAVQKHAEGARAFKIFLTDSIENATTLLRRLREGLPPNVELFVDALWRLDFDEACRLVAILEDLHVGWLEAPLAPEDLEAHAALASVSRVPIAIGECYRSFSDFQRIAGLSAASVLQPDLGRCGITLTSQIMELCDERSLRFAPHLSISMGPQIAAAMHVSAVAGSLLRMEINPQILSIAQGFLLEDLNFGAETAIAPAGPGLGVHIDQSAIDAYTTVSAHLRHLSSAR